MFQHKAPILCGFDVASLISEKLIEKSYQFILTERNLINIIFISPILFFKKQNLTKLMKKKLSITFKLTISRSNIEPVLCTIYLSLASHIYPPLSF